MIITKNDPLWEYFNKSTLNEENQYQTFINWKFSMLKDSEQTKFIKLSGSMYILAVELFSPYQTLFGIWDIERNYGYSFIGYNIGLSRSKYSFEFIPTSQLTDSSEFLQTSRDQLYAWSFELTKAMLSSKEHQNKSSDEIAIKAVKTAASLKNRIAEYNDLMRSLVD